MPVPLTRRLGAFVAGCAAGSIPPALFEEATRGLIDCVGVAIAGARDPAVDVVERVSETADPAGEAGLIGRPGRASAPQAAAINGTAAHALDYDDVGLMSHPSAVLVPTLLAEGEVLGSSGRDALAAYVIAYEIWHELSRREALPHHGKGWHPTAVFGTVACAAAAARLRGLDAVRSSHALALAASFAGGLVANFGSMAKPYHAGRTAESGIRAARLAAAGMTGAADVLEHPRGFLHAFSPTGRVDLEDESRLGTTWALADLGLNIKLHPVCYSALRATEAALMLSERLRDAHDAVEQITVTTSPTQASILKYNAPKTGPQAKFSMEYLVAAAIAKGRLGLAELTDEVVRRDDAARALMRRVTIQTTEAPHPDMPGFALADHVEVRLCSGETLASGPVHHASGSARRPATFDQLSAKFIDCVRPAYGEDRTVRLFDRLRGFGEDGVRDVAAALQFAA